MKNLKCSFIHLFLAISIQMSQKIKRPRSYYVLLTRMSLQSNLWTSRRQMRRSFVEGQCSRVAY